MPSTSGAQHRFVGWLHSDPEAARAHGLSEGKVSEWLHSDKGKPWERHASGGIVARQAGGILPAAQTQMGGNIASQNPITGSALQQLSALPTEKLQEFASRVPPGTPQGQIIQRALQMRLMNPQAAAAQPQPQEAPAAIPTAQPMPGGPGVRRGGRVRRQGGGPLGMSLSMASPWWERSEERNMDAGFLHGSTLGRADQISTSAPGGSYIVPADVVSGLGEGNSLAGASVIDKMLHSGPHGISMPRMERGPGPPRPPSARMPSDMGFKRAGGVPRGATGSRTPVKLSHGEYEIGPDDVHRIGRRFLIRSGQYGDPLHTGHKILDAWVIQERKKNIGKLKKLPPPVKP